MNNRQEVKLGDVCDVLNGRAYKQSELLNTGKYPVLRVGNFFSRDKWYYSNLELEESKYCNNGDLLFAWSASFGPKIWNNGKVIYHYHIWKLQPNLAILDKLYLFYWLKESTSLLTQGIHGSVMAHLTKSDMEKMLISLPPLDVQKKIAGVLGALDDKIELNNKINQNLEAQAQALFKSWFVDFEPFGGKMPDDWKTGKLKDIIKLKRNTIKAGENSQLPYLPIDVIPMNSLAINEVKANSEAQSSLITFEKDDILIGAMRVYFHRVIIAPCAGITRTTCFVLSPFKKEFLSYAILLCNQNSSIEFAQKTSKGSTMPYAIWEGGLGELDVPIPSQEIAEKFNNIIFPLIKQIQNSYFENKCLAELRDTLLPKLMTGEIDVDNVKID